MTQRDRRRRFLLYGATGFSGRLAAQRARQRGLAPVLAGRDAARVGELANALRCESRAFALDQPAAVSAALADVAVVLNAAGPFTATAQPLVEGCLRTATHYLDLSGELPVLADTAQRDAEARASGIMLMPAVGFLVVPSDCLAAHVAHRLPGAQQLTIAVSRTDAVSPGSLRTILAHWSDTVAVRRAGVLTRVPIGQLERRVDYGRGPSRSTAVSWGDLLTAHHTTGIPDIEVYLEVSPAERAMFRLSHRVGALLDALPVRQLLSLPAGLLGDGPSDRQRAGAGRVIVAEARDGAGRRARARLRTPEAYGFTAVTALAIVERVLNGDLQPGFQTPGGRYGPDFVLTLDGVVREDG
jgi:short subunit dehydrogenase-like uncharacterized protein